MEMEKGKRTLFVGLQIQSRGEKPWSLPGLNGLIPGEASFPASQGSACKPHLALGSQEGGRS